MHIVRAKQLLLHEIFPVQEVDECLGLCLHLERSKSLVKTNNVFLDNNSFLCCFQKTILGLLLPVILLEFLLRLLAEIHTFIHSGELDAEFKSQHIHL